MISLSKAGTSPQLVATFCMRVDLGWERVYSQLLQASAGQEQPGEQADTSSWGGSCDASHHTYCQRLFLVLLTFTLPRARSSSFGQRDCGRTKGKCLFDI